MAVGEETHGVISMCSEVTASECFSLNLFGNSSMRLYQDVTEETCLFLYNYSTKQLHGTWRCTAQPSWNPGSVIYGGQFPAHLPVERVCNYPPVPLAGKAAEILGCSKTMVFEPFLSKQQVTELCALMRDGGHAEQNGGNAGEASPSAQEGIVASSPVAGLLGDANATVTAAQCSTAEKVSLVQESLANARALADNPHTPDSNSLRESAACLEQAMNAVRGLQGSLPANRAAPAEGGWPQSLQNGHAIPMSLLEEGQMSPSLVIPRLASRPDRNGAAQNSLPCTPTTDSSGHASEGSLQQPGRRQSLANAFDEALLDVMQTPAAGQQRKVRKKKKRRVMPVNNSLHADLGRQASLHEAPLQQAWLQENEVMRGALICACSGEQLDECYAQHRFLVPPYLASQHQRIPQGLPVFLFNNDARLLLGPFYAKETALTNTWVDVEEREPPLVVQERELLNLLPADLGPRKDQGYNITGAHAADLLSKFGEAAVLLHVQPYRYLATELGGVVFTCKRDTLRECLERKVFGMMQDAFVPIVQHIRPGLPIFLFNSSHRILMGPFSATSHGGMLIEPDAWGRRGHASPFPAQVRVMPHEPVVGLMETEYKPLLGHTMYYSPTSFHFDLNREEVTVLLQLMSQRRPCGASLPFLTPMYQHPLNPSQGAYSTYLQPPAVQQQSQPGPPAWLLPGPSSAVQPPPQPPPATAAAPFVFRGAQVQQFGLAPTVRVPPPLLHSAAGPPQSTVGQGVAQNGFVQGHMLGSTGHLANGSSFTAPPARGSEAGWGLAPVPWLHGTRLRSAEASGAAAASGGAQQGSELANGLPPSKRHRLANMALTDHAPAPGSMIPGLQPGQLREPDSNETSIHGSGPGQNGTAQSRWGWGTSNGPMRSAQAPGGNSALPAQPQPSSVSPFAVFAKANQLASQLPSARFAGFAQPSAVALQGEASAQMPGSSSRTSSGHGAQPSAPAASTSVPFGQPRPVVQQPPSIFQANGTPSSQERPPPPPAWSPGATPPAGAMHGTLQNGGQASPLPQQEHLQQHSPPPGPHLQQDQQEPVSNLMDTINALPQRLGALPSALLGQQSQLAAVIRAALGATVELQVALQAILAVLEPKSAAAPSPAAASPAPAPAPAPASPSSAPAPAPVASSQQHTTPSPAPAAFTFGQQAQPPAEPPSGAWTGFQTPAPQPQQGPWRGCFGPTSGPQPGLAPEWPPAASASFAAAPRSDIPPAAAVGQAFGSPYTPTHVGLSPLHRPGDGNLPAAPAFGFATSAGMQQQQQQNGGQQEYAFQGGEYAGEMPSYVSGMGAADTQKKPGGVCMRIRRPKTVKKKKAAQKRKSGGLPTPSSTRKQLQQELRELAAEQAEAGALAVVASTRPARQATLKTAKTSKAAKTPKSTKTKGSAKKASSMGVQMRQLRSAAKAVAVEEQRSLGAKRKRTADEDGRRTLVAFDTNVFMGSTKDRNMIIHCLRMWRGLDPQIHILLPRTVVNELKTISTSFGNRKAQSDAKLGMLVLNTLLNSSICRVQMEGELPAGRVVERLKDDGILDCLLHFAAKGDNVLLCTNDKQFITRAQAQGLDAIKPEVLRGNHSYPKVATPKAAYKKRRQELLT